MSSKATIKDQIERKIGRTKYGIWRIGLTHDLDERKRYWGNTEGQSVAHWSSWIADSLKDAQDLEAYFIAEGMKGGTGGDLSPRRTVYVYVF